MGKQVLLTIPDEIYEQAERLAVARDRNLVEVLVEAIDLGPELTDMALPEEPDETIEREKAAYFRLHAELWQKYPGEHVAVYGGELVDHDTDGVALSLRIYERFPGEFVLIRQVEPEPDQVLYFRSPRFAQGDV